MSRYIDLDKLNEYPIRLNHYDKENGNVNFVYGIESVLEYANSLPVFETEIAQNWISVKDKMPESGVYVLAVCEVSKIGGSKGYCICDAFYTSKFSHFARNCDDMECDYNEENDEYYFPVGWWEVIRNWDDYSCVAIEDKVVYWMPLPSTEGLEVQDDDC